MIKEYFKVSHWRMVSVKTKARKTDFVRNRIPDLTAYINRYKRERPKVDASIFDSALSHTRRSDASEKKRSK